MEELRVQYREWRDDGKFTPTRTSPVQSAAASVSGDDDPNNLARASVGSGEVDQGAEGANADVPVPLGEGPPLAWPMPGGTGKRRCVEANAGGGTALRISVRRSHQC